MLLRKELARSGHRGTSSVYHTVIIIKSKSRRYLLARDGVRPLSAPQTALHLSDWILVP